MQLPLVSLSIDVSGAAIRRAGIPALVLSGCDLACAVKAAIGPIVIRLARGQVLCDSHLGKGSEEAARLYI